MMKKSKILNVNPNGLASKEIWNDNHYLKKTDKINNIGSINYNLHFNLSEENNTYDYLRPEYLELTAFYDREPYTVLSKGRISISYDNITHIYDDPTSLTNVVIDDSINLFRAKMCVNNLTNKRLFIASDYELNLETMFNNEVSFYDKNNTNTIAIDQKLKLVSLFSSKELTTYEQTKNLICISTKTFPSPAVSTKVFAIDSTGYKEVGYIRGDSSFYFNDNSNNQVLSADAFIVKINDRELVPSSNILYIITGYNSANQPLYTAIQVKSSYRYEYEFDYNNCSTYVDWLLTTSNNNYNPIQQLNSNPFDIYINYTYSYYARQTTFFTLSDKVLKGYFGIKLNIESINEAEVDDNNLISETFELITSFEIMPNVDLNTGLTLHLLKNDYNFTIYIPYVEDVQNKTLSYLDNNGNIQQSKYFAFDFNNINIECVKMFTDRNEHLPVKILGINIQNMKELT